MQVTKLILKNFRCFSNQSLNFQNQIVLIEGVNGSGKTSILEALHYACYLRSFRTHLPRELVFLEHDTFFVKAEFVTRDSTNHEVHVGFSGKKRLVKLDQKPIRSYKELMDFYRVITITEDDLALIQDGPEVRRAFIDQAVILDDPDFVTTLRHCKTVLESRNKLLQSHTIDPDSYDIWTQQLREWSAKLVDARIRVLTTIGEHIATLIHTFFDDSLRVELAYQVKKEPKELFWQEKRFGRSLFGAHLDDIRIDFANRGSKSFASRGQQKLIVALIKIAQVQAIIHKQGSVIVLLDDFLTDFDEKNLEILLKILKSLDIQLIFTAPTRAGLLEEKLVSMGAQKLVLTP